MRKFLKEFALRGLVAAAGGPVVLAIIYGILGATGAVSLLSPKEVCLGILTITVLAFVVAGMTAIYRSDQLPLASAILIHGGVLYATYLLIYLLNGWLQRQWFAIAVFTGVFLAVYGLTWLIVYWSIRSKAKRINDLLKEQAQKTRE